MMTTGVVFQPIVSQAMSSGADSIVNAIKLTLGPLARTVLVERGAGRHVAPDVLRDSGTIVRRLVALQDADADVGAMLLRNALWRVHERAGDGVATCAVLFQAMVQHARRYVAAGGNAMQMRSGILRAAEAACDAIHQQAEPLDGAKAAMHRWVAAHCDDAPLAETIAQILATTGADSSIVVENAQGTRIEHEFIRGAFFKTGWHASPFAPHEVVQNRMLRLPDAHVLVSDLDLSDPSHMQPLIMALTHLKPPRLMIVCRKVSAQLQTLFVQARQKGIGDVVFVQPPSVSGPDRLALLSDMALLVGATFIPHIEENGAHAMMNLTDLLPACLGRAEVAWASEHFAGIETGASGGCGAQATQVAHLGKLDAMLQAEEQPERIKFYQERIAAFGGGTTRLKVGAHTDSEQKQRKAAAERAVRLATQANRFGVVPGAGMALLLCEKAARKVVAQPSEADEKMGAECVVRALIAPMCAIAENAGLEGASIVARNRTAKRGWGFDMIAGRVVNLRKAGLLDSAFVLETALRTAASAAATFITTDVIVHRRQTEAALRP